VWKLAQKIPERPGWEKRHQAKAKGALGLGVLGKSFPSSCPTTVNVPSVLFLSE
jgi:hypothetical protein